MPKLGNRIVNGGFGAGRSTCCTSGIGRGLTMQVRRRATSGLGRDFLAVFEVRPGPSFGKLVTMLPVGMAMMAHHTNYAEPHNDVLYANDWLGNSTYVFDLREPLHPRLLRKFGSVGACGYPHSFVYLANGNTLATFQYSGGFNHAAGGLVEFDLRGRVVGTASAVVPGHPDIRPYSMAVVETLNRVVTGSADMMEAQYRTAPFSATLEAALREAILAKRCAVFDQRRLGPAFRTSGRVEDLH